MMPANAYKGVYGMDIIAAEDAVYDDEALRSKGVQDAIKDFRMLYQTVRDLKSAVEKDSQLDVQTILKKDFDIIKIRTTFNELTPAFDKDTQKGTDIITRGIIQDVVEIYSSAKVPEGKQRSEKRILFLTEKIDKLLGSFGKLDAYIPA